MNDPLLPRGAAGAVRDAVYWLDRKSAPLRALTGTTTVDVVVVGGGMMGLMCARTLTMRGARVALVEANSCGAGASGRSSGFITPDSELEFHDLVRQFGAVDATRLWTFARGGASLIRSAIQDDGIDCDFRVQDGLYVAASSRDFTTVAEEHAARTAAGFAGTLLGPDDLQNVLGGSAYFGGLRFPDTFGIDGYRCCTGLRCRLIENGVSVFEQSPVTRVSASGVETAAGAVRADHVVVCTDHHLPALGLAPREIFHAQTFLAVTEPLPATAVAQIFPAGPVMVWDTSLIYNYFRLTEGPRLLIGGGTLASTYALREQHRPARVARRLTRFLARHFPGVRVRFEAAWPGFIGISKDFAPVIGRHPLAANVLFAGGAAGLPWAAALGRYLADKVLNGAGELDALLAVDRSFAIGPKLQAILGRPASFALAHGLAKLSSG